MKIIDAHTHIGTQPEFGLTSGTLEDAAESLLAEMKLSRVDHAIVIASPWEKCWCGGDSATNEILLNFAKKYKQISIVWAIDMAENKTPDYESLEKSLQSKEIVGVKFYTGYQSFYPNDPRCQPIYKLCEKYDVPVMFHSGDTLASVGYIKYSQPIHIDDVATDFPNLKIIIAHLGNPWMRDTAELLYRHKNVYADISGLFIKESIGDKATLKLYKNWISEVIVYAGAKKLLYGTDYPLVEMKPYIKFARSLGIKGENLDLLMWKNAAKLFRV
jgi:predicted TIM-barrel fold metal-dependent hydrolase